MKPEGMLNQIRALAEEVIEVHSNRRTVSAMKHLITKVNMIQSYGARYSDYLLMMRAREGLYALRRAFLLLLNEHANKKMITAGTVLVNDVIIHHLNSMAFGN